MPEKARKRRLVRHPRSLTDADPSQPQRPPNPREEAGVAPHPLERSPQAEGDREDEAE